MTAAHLEPASFAGWTIDQDPNAQRTLSTMAKFVHAAMADPYIVRYANEIIAAARPRDYRAQIGAIRLFGRSWFRFVDNPVGVQRVRTPLDMITDVETIGYVQGACDDAAVLMATLGMANGLEARFRAVAFAHRSAPDDSVPFSHVIADLFAGDGWDVLDITKPDDLQRPPHVVRTLTMDLS
jgi:transglutaminase-like putative cysteine protease